MKCKCPYKAYKSRPPGGERVGDPLGLSGCQVIGQVKKNRKTGHCQLQRIGQKKGFSSKKRTKIGFFQENNLFSHTFIHLTGYQAVKRVFKK